MREYCHSKNTCLRKLLLKHFGCKLQNQLPMHSCCDICYPNCKCCLCEKDRSGSATGTISEVGEECVRHRALLHKKSRDLLKRELEEYRQEQRASWTICFGGNDLNTGLTLKLLEDVLSHCELVKDVDYLMANFEFWFSEQAVRVFKIIEKHTKPL